MKKFLALLLSLLLVFVLFAGCASSNTSADDKDTNKEDSSDNSNEDSEDKPEKTSGNAEIALIVSALSSINDRGFFQGTYEGMQEWCEENGKTCTYYDPQENSLDALYEAIDVAVLNGAKVIVISGGDFIGMMEEVFATYPDLLFICNELPYTEPGENSMIYIFRAQESGYLLGKAMVYEGYRKIGAIAGLEILPVVRACYGFVQGVNDACAELNLSPEDVYVRFWYSGYLAASDDVQTTAAAWIQDGIEVMCCICGGASTSVFAACDKEGIPCTGNDTDQYYLSDNVITSVLKNVGNSAVQGLDAWRDGKFQSGIQSVGIAEDAVGLAMEHSKMKNVTQDMVDEWSEYLKNNTIYTAEDYEHIDALWAALDHNFTLDIVSNG